MNNTELYVAGGIVLLGFFICLFLISRSNRKSKAIEHYEKIRDELTLRDIKPIKVDKREYTGLSLGNLIGGFITLLVGITLLPMIAEEVGSICNNQVSNSTDSPCVPGPDGIEVLGGASGSIIGLVTMFFALAIMITAISVVVSGLKSAGLMCDPEYDEKVNKAKGAINHYENMRDSLTKREKI